MSEGMQPTAPVLHVAPGPHLSDNSFTTRRMMLDVLIALAPVTLMAFWVFGMHAAKQIGVCVVSCLLAEAIFHSFFRKKPLPWGDLSAVVTGVILALSFPWSAPWWVGAIAGMVAIGIGKVIFGGLGMNIFNPAMVGRAFVMISFAGLLGAPAYISANADDQDRVISQATPLTAAKDAAKATLLATVKATESKAAQAKADGTTGPMKEFYAGETKTARESAAKAESEATEKAKSIPLLWPLFLGTVNGSLGEISVILCLLGGLYLCWRKTASWEVPVAIIGSVVAFAGLAQVAGIQPGVNLAHHLFGGALVFGAFFIATDPVTNPLTFKGKVIFGVGTGFFIMLIRIFSGYPEGFMFAVLLMNALVPLINTWTIPTPVGGPVPVKK